MVAAIDALRKQIASCENTLHDLRQQLAEAEHVQRDQQEVLRPTPPQSHDPLHHDMNFGVSDAFRSEIFAVLGQDDAQNDAKETKWPLEKNEYKRYGRQLIMPEIGLQGQLRLKRARVLIVGVGGLGCPAAAYLVGAGVGTIGLVDGDTVEESNLHRQILHSTAKVGMSKVESATISLTSLNPNVKIIPHISRLTPESAVSTFNNYDLVLDCTDTPASRYLISDTCVLLHKPLVSASALRIDGQLMVLNDPPLPPGDTSGGPCYRCVFPKPPPPESVVSCGDGGILGPVVGVMGVLQALEAIKVLTRPQNVSAEPPSLLIFSAYSNPMFRTIRLRTRKANCVACSAQSTISAEALQSGSLDYVQFCGSVGPVTALTPQERVSPGDFAKLRVSGQDGHILVDTREQVHFELCSIKGSINIPFSQIERTRPTCTPDQDIEDDWVSQLRRSEKPIFVMCRRGNDSQLSVRKMKELGLDLGGRRLVGDVRGGLEAWRRDVDGGFPEY